MQNPPVCKVQYRRSRFSTRLPDDRSYTASHFWVKLLQGNTYQVGFTQFATRMLGDLVEHGFEVKPGQEIELGEIVGWIEAFKATTDLYSVGSGKFLRGNPTLDSDPTVFDRDPYGEGWLYEFTGTPDKATVDVSTYTKILDLAIDKIQGKSETGG